MFCRNCGHQVPNGSGYCEACGEATRLAPGYGRAPGGYHPAAKSRIAAGILGIVLGHIGVHRFYMGFIGIGIIQILVTLCTFGIGGLWGFIEGIIILTGGFKTDAHGMPLRD